MTAHMLALLLTLGIGCTAPQASSPPDAPAPVVHLAVDSYFTGVSEGYASPDDCYARAEMPRSCTFELVFCANGQAGSRAGDVVVSGDYRVENNHALAVLAPGTSLDFDLVTDRASGDSETLAQYIPDVVGRHAQQEWDVINCAL